MTGLNARRLAFAIILLMAVFLLPPVCAQENAPEAPEADSAQETTGPGEKPAEAERDEDDERVRLEWADDFYYNEDEKTYYLTGNVQILHKGVRLYADRAEYYEDTDSAKATGNLKAVDPEATITGDLVEADFDEEIIVVTGNVRIVAQKEKDEDKDEQAAAQEAQPTGESEESTEDASEQENGDEPETFEEYAERRTVITSDRLEYRYNEDVETATATGNVKAVQEDKTVWAEKAVYERIPDIITLTGHVRFVRENGDEGRAPKVVISTEEDWIRAESVRGITLRRSDEDDEGSQE